MSHRLNHIQQQEPVRPELVAEAFRRVAQILDAADDHHQVVIATSEDPDVPMKDIALAWTMAAITIADMTDITSEELNSMADIIIGVTQNALWN